MEKIIEADKKLSKWLFNNNKFVITCQWIEWMVHGFPWFFSSFLALVCVYGRNFSSETQHIILMINFGLYLDLFLIAILKFTFQRKRPQSSKKMFMEHSIDVFSFPSGHTSRSMMLILIFCHIFPNFKNVLMLLPFIVGSSRVALGCHFISDVVAGYIIGYAEGVLITYLPMSVNIFFKNILK